MICVDEVVLMVIRAEAIAVFHRLRIARVQQDRVTMMWAPTDWGGSGYRELARGTKYFMMGIT
jgi:hypothetical protein